MGIDQAVKRVLIEVHRVLIEISKFSTNQMQYTDLGSDTSSVWLSRENQWWPREFASAFLGYSESVNDKFVVCPRLSSSD